MKRTQGRFFTGILIFLSFSLTSVCLWAPVTYRTTDTLDIEMYTEINKYAEKNEYCFSCHAENRYQLTDESTGNVISFLMDQGKIILRNEFYHSNHKHLSCTKCHSEKFEEFPHPVSRKETGLPGCLDCHGNNGNDPLGFKKIEEEYLQSIHHKAVSGLFSCWKCHDPHVYAIGFRSAETMAEAITYDNEICLSCHNNPERYKKYTDRDAVDLNKRHDWLPNKGLHFKHVRCIECHTRVNEDILVAHLILPEQESVRNCNECHSTNSLLLSTLYKHRTQEARNKLGFVNSLIMSDVYVIGANRNLLLNWLSLAAFGLTFISIAIHIIFRIINKV